MNSSKQVNNRKTRRCEIDTTLTKKTSERNHAALVSLLLTLNIFHTFSSVSNVEFEKVNVYWAVKSVLNVF